MSSQVAVSGNRSISSLACSFVVLMVTNLVYDRGVQPLDADFAFAPHGLAADAGPTGGFEIREELAQIAFIVGFADEAADFVGLAGFGAAAASGLVVRAEGGHPDLRCAGVGALEIDAEVLAGIEAGERGDAVADAAEKYGEFGGGRDLVVVLELGRSEEDDPDVSGCVGVRGQGE